MGVSSTSQWFMGRSCLSVTYISPKKYKENAVDLLPSSNSLATVAGPHILTTFTNVPWKLYPNVTHVIFNGKKISALLYSCSTDSYLIEGVVRKLNLKVYLSSKGITIAQKTLNINSRGYVVVNLTLCLNDQLYVVTRSGVLKDLLSQDFLCQHHKATFKYGGFLSEWGGSQMESLSWQHFTLVIDQRSVAFMFNNERCTKIKNAKIQKWWWELAAFDYMIKCHWPMSPGTPMLLKRFVRNSKTDP